MGRGFGGVERAGRAREDEGGEEESGSVVSSSQVGGGRAGKGGNTVSYGPHTRTSPWQSAPSARTPRTIDHQAPVGATTPSLGARLLVRAARRDLGRGTGGDGVLPVGVGRCTHGENGSVRRR